MCSANLLACEELTKQFQCDLVLIESGGDNLAADFSRELADFTGDPIDFISPTTAKMSDSSRAVYVIDVAGGDKVPRKGGPGITQSDVLVVNKTDLAEAVGASLDVMRRDARKMRGESGPVVMAQVKNGEGVSEIASLIEAAWLASTSKSESGRLDKTRAQI